MNTKSLGLIAIGIILISAMAVSYLISRPALFAGQRSVPVFVGEEITVHRASTAVTASKAVKVVPMPQPKVAAPLPIFPPKISYSVLPNYPVSALQQELEGTAILSIYVGLNGKPEKLEVKSSSGVSELDVSALKAVSQWRFEPATQGGSAIASRIEFPVRFEIK